MLVVLFAFFACVLGSSHSEAPGTARHPHSDLTDFYMFNTQRGNVGIVMNVAGLIQSQAGPNYNPVSTDFLYNIHVDNNGDGVEDITFQFMMGYRYINNGRGFEVPVQGFLVPIPLAQFSAVTANPTTRVQSGLNVEEYYQLRVFHGADYTQAFENGPFATTVVNGAATSQFNKAFDNAGTRTFPPGTTGFDGYNAYVKNASIYTNVVIPGCSQPMSVFVGPRREPFGIALGEIFDLLNVAPAGAPVKGTRAATQANFNGDTGDGNSLDRFSVISFVIEVPPACLVSANNGRVLGAYASVRSLEHTNSQHFAGDQVTRLGNPLVNELLIGTTYKNEWNSRSPSTDIRFEPFLLTPAVPALVELLFGSAGIVAQAGANAPAFPRTDLVAVLHTGIPGVNQPVNEVTKNNVVHADLLRINLDLAPFVACTAQNSMGVIGGDNSGYPNGRRLGDDIVDLTLQVAEGILCKAGAATAALCNGGVTPASTAALTYSDNAPMSACMFQCGVNDFPFLNPPLPGDQLFKVNINALFPKSQFADRTNVARGHCPK
jgi:hypothetical protein